MKLVVGLGNPGKKYEWTRHNVGFWVVDKLAADHRKDHWQSQFDGLVLDVRLGVEKVMLLKPATFMNRSGQSVRKAVDFYKIELADLLVVADDFNLDLARLRLRGKGSAGGQNGLKDIIAHLGTEEFSRLRVGIGSPGRIDPADFVLTKFAESDRDVVLGMVSEASVAVESWATRGLAWAMNEFNRK